MATDRELITGVVHDRTGGASAAVRPVLSREYLHLVMTGGGWKIAGTLWLAQ